MSAEDMLAMLGTGGTPFELLSSLCTVLAIDESGIVPLEPINQIMTSLIPCLDTQGDLAALGARAMATIVERNPTGFAKNKKSVEALQAIFASVVGACAASSTTTHSDNSFVRCGLTFEHTSEGEWAEDVARLILVVLNSPDEALRAAADPSSLALGVTNILQLSSVSVRAKSKLLGTVVKLLHALGASPSPTAPAAAAGKGRKTAKAATPPSTDLYSTTQGVVYDVVRATLLTTSELGGNVFGNAEEELLLRTCECLLFFAQRKGARYISEEAVLSILLPLLQHIAVAEGVATADNNNNSSPTATVLSLRSHIALATIYSYLTAEGIDNSLLFSFTMGSDSSGCVVAADRAKINALLQKVLPLLVQVGLSVSLPTPTSGLSGSPGGGGGDDEAAASSSIVPVSLLQPIEPYPVPTGGGGPTGLHGAGGPWGGGSTSAAPKTGSSGANNSTSRLAVGGYWALPPIQPLVLAMLQFAMPHHTSHTGSATTFDVAHLAMSTLTQRHRWQWCEGEVYKSYDAESIAPTTDAYFDRTIQSKNLTYLSRHHSINFNLMLQLNSQSPSRSREVRFQPVPTNFLVKSTITKMVGSRKQVTADDLESGSSTLSKKKSTTSTRTKEELDGSATNLGLILKLLVQYHQECSSTNKELLPVVRTVLLQVLDTFVVSCRTQFLKSFPDSASLEGIICILQQMIKEDVNSKCIAQLLLFVTGGDGVEAKVWATALQAAGFHAALLETEPACAAMNIKEDDEVEIEERAPKKRKTSARTSKVDPKKPSPLTTLFGRLTQVGGGAGSHDNLALQEPSTLSPAGVVAFAGGAGAETLYSYLRELSHMQSQRFMESLLTASSSEELDAEAEDAEPAMDPTLVVKAQKKAFTCLQRIYLESVNEMAARSAGDDAPSLPSSVQFIRSLSSTSTSTSTAQPATGAKKRGRPATKSATSGSSASTSTLSLHSPSSTSLSSVVRVAVCTAITGKLTKCPKGHLLAPHHSVLWSCNKCGQHQNNASMACRKCDYDVCASCSGVRPFVLSTSPLATVGQFLQEVVGGASRRRPAIMELLMAQLGAEGLGDAARGLLMPGMEMPDTQLKRVPLQLTIDGTPLSSGLPLATVILQALQQTGEKKGGLDVQSTKAAELLNDLVTSAPNTFDVGGVEPLLVHCFADPTSAQCRCGSVDRVRFTDGCDDIPISSTTPSTNPPPPQVPYILRAAAELAESPGLQRKMQQGSEHLVAAVRTALVDHAGSVALFQLAGVPLWTKQLMQYPFRRFLPIEFRREASKFIHFGAWRSLMEKLSRHQTRLPGQIDLDLSEKGARIKGVVGRGDLEKARGIHEVLPPMRNKLEVSFADEAGTGEGPTQEFYAELATSIVRHKEMWRLSEEGIVPGEPFPSGAGPLLHFQAMGACASRALLDGYWSSLRLHPCTWAALSSLLNEPHDTTSTSVSGSSHEGGWRVKLAEDLDPGLQKQFTRLLSLPEGDLPSLGLCLPADNDDTAEEEEEVVGTQSQLRRYMAGVAEDAILNPSKPALEQFALGLSVYINPRSFLQAFESHEMNTVFCGLSGDDCGPRFTAADLRNAVIGAHGYTTDSKEVKQFIEVLVAFSPKEQTYFVEWLTGSTQLPPGGLCSLGKQITVVKKDMGHDGGKERMLPSCNTCFLYVKLPSYSSIDVLKQRLLLAVAEGRRNFALS